VKQQNYNVDLVDDPAYWRTKADLSDQTAVILLSGTDNRVPESNGVDGVIGMRHHAGMDKKTNGTGVQFHWVRKGVWD
jgi:hypothetical protein